MTPVHGPIEDLAQRILASSPEAVCMFDLAGRIRFANPATCERLNIGAAAEATGRVWLDTWPSNLRERLGPAIDRARGGFVHRETLEVTETDGPLRWQEFVLSPIQDTDGVVVGVACATHDVTALQVELREAQARERRLASSTAALRAAGRIAQLGGWDYDVVARRVFFSNELVGLIGAVGYQDYDEANRLWDPEDALVFDRVLSQAIADCHELVFEGCLHTPAGHRWVRILGEPVMQDGHCIAMRGATQDITEQREATERLEASEQAARVAADAMSSFLATMSHEIRTPLNGIMGMTQVIAGGDLTPALRENIGVIQKSGEALLGLLNDLLDLSRIASGKVELELGVVDTQTLADEAAVFAMLAHAKGVGFTVTLAPAARGRWAGDPLRVRQVLNNLVGNAVKFTDKGEIGVEIDSVEGALILHVHDTGVGIPADKLEQVFNPFTQADASTTRRFGGSGLGLAICRDLVALMGGEIGLKSELGGGAAFTVSLPLERLEDDDAAYEVESPSVDARAGLRVLAAEDNLTNRLVLRTLLEAVGIEPVIVDDGAKALAAWRRGEWDVILMDIQMPVMDGVDATKAIREAELAGGGRHTPIIALTANAMAHHRAEYVAAGMDGFVAKPIDVRLLVQAIEAATTEAAAMPAAA